MSTDDKYVLIDDIFKIGTVVTRVLIFLTQLIKEVFLNDNSFTSLKLVM